MLADRAEPCFTHDSLLWALEAICVRLQQAFLPQNVARELVPPHTLHVLQRAAARAGVEARIVAASPAALASLTLPCVIELRGASGPADGDGPVEGGGRDASLAVIVGREPNGFRLLASGTSQPQVVSAAEVARRYLGRAVTFNRQAPPDPDSTREQGAGRFGIASVAREAIRHRQIWRDVMIASIAIQFVALLLPLLTQVVIDKVIVHHALSTLLVVAVALAAILLFNAAMTWVRQYLVLHAGNRVDAALGERVLERLLALPARYFEHRPTGTLVARLQGVEVIREFVAGAGVTLLLDVPLALLFLVLMFWYSATLTVIVMAGIALLIALSLAVTPALRARVDRQFLQAARNQAFLTETVAAIDTVKALQMEPGLRARYAALLASYLQAGLAARSLANGLNVSATALEQAMTATVLCVGAWLVMEHGALTIGMLVAFQMLAGRVTGPMLRAAALWQDFQRVRIAADRLGDIMNVAPEPAGGDSLRPAPTGGQIEVRQLSFRYENDGPFLLRDLSLTIATGECVALMGPSGSGKSTLARLLIGFYRPSEGRIMLDGVDVRDLGAAALRASFGVVPQETRLFAGTVFDNLAAACPRASFDEVVSACRLAGVHDIVNALPNGYGSWVGEQGVGLSGGQRQRIAIARALLRRAPILLFDEATSSLDDASAALVAQTINLDSSVANPFRR